MKFIKIIVVTVSLILVCYAKFGTSIPTQVITLGQNVTVKQPRLPLLFVGTVGEKLFFKESTSLTWDQALINCINARSGLALANITTNAEIDGLKPLSVTGQHWINGIDKGNSTQFKSYTGGEIPTDLRNHYSPVTCLAIADHGTFMDIHNFDCMTRLPSLCTPVPFA